MLSRRPRIGGEGYLRATEGKAAVVNRDVRRLMRARLVTGAACDTQRPNAPLRGRYP